MIQIDAIYARQSVDKKDSISIETQIEAGKKISGDKPCKVYDKDKGFSGKNTDRPDFRELIRDIEQGLIGRVIVYKIDRISRSIVDFSAIIQIFEKYGVEFVSVTESFDTSTPIGKAMLYIIMVFAQLERETIQERIRGNYYARMKAGIGKGGSPPFGFKKIPSVVRGKNTKILAPEDREAELVEQIYNIYGNTDITLHKLKEKLTEESDLKRFFTDSFLNLLLRNPIYVKADADVYFYLKSKGAVIENDIDDFTGTNGCFAYANASERTRQRFTDLSKTHIAIHPHEGIVHSDIWLKCNRRLDKNSAFKNSGAGTYTWLTGLMKCAYCGFAVFATGNGTRQNPGDKYINCRGRIKKICYARKTSFNVSSLEKIAGELILAFLKLRSNTKLSEKKKENDKTINSLKIELSHIENKIENLLNSIAEGNQVFSKYANEKIKDLDKERGRINAEITKEITNGDESDKLNTIDREYIINHWDFLNFEQKKNIAKLIIKAAVISNEGMDIYFF